MFETCVLFSTTLGLILKKFMIFVPIFCFFGDVLFSASVRFSASIRFSVSCLGDCFVSAEFACWDNRASSVFDTLFVVSFAGEFCGVLSSPEDLVGVDVATLDTSCSVSTASVSSESLIRLGTVVT